MRSAAKLGMGLVATLFTGPWAMGAGGERPRLEEALSKGMVLSETPREISARGAAIAIHVSGPGDKVVGSATRVCLSDVSPELARAVRGRDWYVTAAHVVGDEKAFLSGPRSLQLEMLDEGMDLALLSSAESREPCYLLARRLALGGVYDIEAGFGTPQVGVEIEAPRVTDWKTRIWRMRTPVATALGSGLPGRDGAGPIMVLLAQGFRGQSGGAILGQPDLENGYLDYLRESGVTLEATSFRRMIGMILAVDSEGRRMAALPSPTIHRRLLHHFAQAASSRGAGLPEKLQIRKTPGGVRYEDSGAVHFRAWLESGTGDLADGGASSSLQVVGRFRSGIQLEGRRWLYLRDSSTGADWSEFEALPPSLKALLGRPRDLQGIYELEDQLWLTDPLMSLPTLSVSVPDSFEDATPEQFDFSREEKIDFYIRNRGARIPCVHTIGIQRARGQTLSRGSHVYLCEFSDHPWRREWGMMIVSPSDDFPVIGIRMELVKVCAMSNRPCALYASARQFIGGPKPGNLMKAWIGIRGLIRSSAMQQSTEMHMEGLRVMRSPSLRVVLSRLGGYRVEYTHGGQNFLISGPGSLSPTYLLRPELLGR